jgi:hypothetical protein
MKTKTIRKSKYTNGGMKFYKSGGMRYMNGGLPQYRARRKFEAGGSMYADNTVQAASQGGAGTTSNIVFQESNPELQLQREQALIDQNKQAIKDAAIIEQEIAAEDQQSVVDIQDAENKIDAMGNTAGAAISTGIELGKQSGVIKKDAGSMGFGSALTAYKGSRAAKNTVQGVKGFNKAKLAMDGYQKLRMGDTAYNMSQMANNVKNLKIGTEGMKTGIQGFSGAKQGLDAVKTGAEITKMGKDGLLVASDSTKALAQGSSIGKGLASLNNANVYAAAANYAGKGINKMSDDDDATTWTAGEGFGDTLSKAGEYAGYGALIGSLGGPLAPLTSTAGAIIGGVVGTGVGLYQGLTGRNKARTAESEYEAKKKIKVDKYNKELMTNFGSQKSRINAGNLSQKTYSGYDLGRNVVAKRGGYRNMPQYI